MKYIKNYNEKLADKLLSPSEDDVLSKIKDLSTEEIVKKSIDHNFKAGIEYVIDERKNELTDDEIYILEKYILGLHKDEEKPYEIWFKEQLINLESFPSKDNKDVIIYKKNDIVLFNYDLKKEIFYYDYYEISPVFETKYNFNRLYIRLLIKYMVEEYLNLSVKTTGPRFY